MKFIGVEPPYYNENDYRMIGICQDVCIGVTTRGARTIYLQPTHRFAMPKIQDLSGIDSRPSGKVNRVIVGASSITFHDFGSLSFSSQSAEFWRYFNSSDMELRKRNHLKPGDDSLTVINYTNELSIDAHPTVLNPTGVATLLLINDGREIVATTKVKRKGDLWKTGLDLVGGYTEPDDETHRQAAQRETLEETGVMVPLDRIQIRGFIANNSIGHAHTSVLATASSPDIKASDLTVGDECDLVVLPNTQDTAFDIIEHLGVSQPYMAGAALLMLANLGGNTQMAFDKIEKHYAELRNPQTREANLAGQRQSITRIVNSHMFRG